MSGLAGGGREISEATILEGAGRGSARSSQHTVSGRGSQTTVGGGRGSQQQSQRASAQRGSRPPVEDPNSPRIRGDDAPSDPRGVRIPADEDTAVPQEQEMQNTTSLLVSQLATSPMKSVGSSSFVGGGNSLPPHLQGGAGLRAANGLLEPSRGFPALPTNRGPNVIPVTARLVPPTPPLENGTIGNSQEIPLRISPATKWRGIARERIHSFRRSVSPATLASRKVQREQEREHLRGTNTKRVFVDRTLCRREGGGWRWSSTRTSGKNQKPGTRGWVHT